MENLDWVGLQFFAGGQSVDKKLGTRYQFYNSRHIDFRKDPNKFTLLPQPRKASGGVVTDLVLDMCLLPNGIYYATGDSGNVYRVATDGGWTLVGNIGQAGAGGIAYRADSDAVYITGTTKVARIKTATTNPTFEQNWFSGGISTDSLAYATGGNSQYTVPVAVTEGSNSSRSFQSDIEPVSKIGVMIISKGTGDWTLTLHDDASNVLASKTITNASLQDNKINYFEFSSQVRLLVKPSARTYHFHLTSTVADGSIATSVSGSMANCDFQIFADALISTTNGFHPIDQIINSTVIGNGRYVTAYEPLQDVPTTADFQRHRIVLPPNYEVCSFARKNMMLITGAEQRSTTGKFQDGLLTFWDGVQTTYNDDYPVPEGSPESLFAEKNVAWFIAGGVLYRIRGLDEPQEVRSFRGTDSEYSSIDDDTRVYPHMLTKRRGILLSGFPSQTTIQTLEHAVYSYGSSSPQFPESFGNSYLTSPWVSYNDGSNNLRIGMVKNFVDTLFISWRNGSTYGVDVVDNTSAPASSATIESLRFEGVDRNGNGRPNFFKRAAFLFATFSTTLPDGITIYLKYKIDGATDWTLGEAVTGASYAVLDVNADFKTIEFGMDITCDGAMSPEITSLYLFYDPMLGTNPINHG